MKKIIFATALSGIMFFAQQSNAQIISGRISLPGFSLRVGAPVRPYYGYNAPVYNRYYAEMPVRERMHDRYEGYRRHEMMEDRYRACR